MSETAALYTGVVPFASFGILYCCSMVFFWAKDWVSDHKRVVDELCRWVVMAGHHLTGAF